MKTAIQHQHVKNLSDQELIEQTEALVQNERQTTVQILRHLREIEVRRLFVELGFSSMYEYCLRRLKYSEGQAQRRLSSARLMTELPEIERQIQSGDLNLTNLSKVQSFVRAEKAVNHSLSKEEKLELLAELENKPTRQVESELLERSHQPALLAEKFQVSVTSLHKASALPATEPLFAKFETLLAPAQQELLQEFKNLYAHELSEGSNHSVLIFLLEKAVHHKKKKLGLPLQQKESGQQRKANNAPLPSAVSATPLRKALKASIRKKIWQRAQACCEHVDAKTQTRCPSKFALEIDHLHSLALGGTDEILNLRLLCRAHNSRRAIKTFGIYKAQ